MWFWPNWKKSTWWILFTEKRLLYAGLVRRCTPSNLSASNRRKQSHELNQTLFFLKKGKGDRKKEIGGIDQITINLITYLSESKLWDQSEIGSRETAVSWTLAVIIISKIRTVAGELAVKIQQCLCFWQGRAAVDSWCSPTPACTWAPRQISPSMPMQLRLWLGQRRYRTWNNRITLERQIDNWAKHRELFTQNMRLLSCVFYKQIQVHVVELCTLVWSIR